MKFNKKTLTFVLVGMFAIALATAGLLTYYGSVEQTVEVKQGLSVDGNDWDEPIEKSYDLDSTQSATFVSSHELTSNTDNEVKVDLESSCSGTGSCPEINTIIRGSLTLIEKKVNFSADVWDIPTDAKEVEVEYTIVGDKFSAEVVEGEESGYELIYYKDKSERFDNPAKAIRLNEIDGNLPYDEDRNSEADGTYDYCDTEEYDTCHGAKLWYVPTDAIDSSDDSLVWSRADEFYFETELIQFNTEGELTIYPGQTLGFDIVSEFPKLTNPGNYTITTKVLP